MAAREVAKRLRRQGDAPAAVAPEEPAEEPKAADDTELSRLRGELKVELARRSQND